MNSLTKINADAADDNRLGSPAISPNPLAPVPEIALELWRDGEIVGKFSLDEYAEREDLTRGEIIAVAAGAQGEGYQVPGTEDVVKRATITSYRGTDSFRADLVADHLEHTHGYIDCHGLALSLIKSDRANGIDRDSDEIAAEIAQDPRGNMLTRV